MSPQSFYHTPWVAEALVRQCHHRYVTVRYPVGLSRHYPVADLMVLPEDHLWSPLGERPFYEIHRADEKLGRWPTNLFYHVDAGALEFIPEVSTVFDLNRTDTIIVDLDPKDPKQFTFEDLRNATKLVHQALCHKQSPLWKQVPIQAWKFRFSGNRSFHIYIQLDKPYPFERLRALVKESLDPVTTLYEKLSYKHLRTPQGDQRTDYVLIDIGALARHRCVRSLWSVHHKTGLVCVPVTDLDTFVRESAHIDEVLKTGPVAEPF